MADTTNRLMIEALVRAAVEPEGVPLLATKTEPGLFPATVKARAAADRCKQEGLLEVVPIEAHGKRNREVCVLTERGKQFLMSRTAPEQLVEDFLRVLESRQGEVTRVREQLEGLTRNLSGMRSMLEGVLPRLGSPEQAHASAHPPASAREARHQASTCMDRLIGEIKARLSEWHAAGSNAAAHDCPLGELFRRLDLPKGTTIGQFHDALRQLHDDDQIYLHPWTGPLYLLPEPAFALLVGHEVAFYASMR